MFSFFKKNKARYKVSLCLFGDIDVFVDASSEKEAENLALKKFKRLPFKKVLKRIKVDPCYIEDLKSDR